MLYAIDNCGIPKFEKDLLSYGVAIFGCERGGAWQWCLSLLGEMQSEQLQPDAVTYACAVQACTAAEKSDAAKAIVAEMRKKRITGNAASILEEASWVIDGPEMQQPVALSALATMAPKEVNVYKYVAKKATPGDIDSVLETIESFAKARSWLKIQGQDKRILLEKSLRAGDRIVEFGCYVGYSSLVMARQLRRLGGQGSVTTIEVDAATAYVARAMISFAGAEGEVQVRVGCASDWVATGQLGTIDFLLLDHRGTIYHEDLHAAEPLLSPTARVFADNVLYPGAPLFLHYLDVKQYNIEIHELKEFLREDLDDWVVISRPTQEHGEMPRDTPPEFRRLSAEVDAISWRSQNGPVDWVGFQERLKPVFYQWKEERGL
jgi:catechol O-methyltransferase